jgi:surface antigen
MAPVSAAGSAEMVAASQPLQCVPFARELSGLPIRGDAWTWWSAAEDRYQYGQEPHVGSVLVLKQTDRLQRGHLAVVTRILGLREVLIDHANWLNRGMIHKDIPLVDVSPANDWSEVRFWYVLGNYLGGHRYPAHGFIYPIDLAVSAPPQSD